jgi:enamine deaminase RidA (YjgF/YER057c/UK114 family)
LRFYSFPSLIDIILCIAHLYTNMSGITRIDSNDRYTEIVINNGMVYLAGQCAEDTTQDVRGQTAQVLKEIDALLARAGTDKSRY